MMSLIDDVASATFSVLAALLAYFETDHIETERKFA